MIANLNESPMLPCGSTSRAKVVWYLKTKAGNSGKSREDEEEERDHLRIEPGTIARHDRVVVVDGQVLAPGMYMFNVCTPEVLNDEFMETDYVGVNKVRSSATPMPQLASYSSLDQFKI
jgi:hypothetical protein